MPAILNARVSAVILSRGSTWSPQPWEPPYLLPDAGQAWPTATAQCVFYDTAGGTLATVDGTVTASGIAFNAAPDVVDLVPNGANFEIFLTVSGDPYQIRYGKVIRREAFFTQTPASVTTPLDFTDSWPTTGLKSTWVTVIGNPVVHDNSGLSLPNGLGALNWPSAQDYNALRWYKPLSGDSVRVKVSALNRHVYGTNSFAKMRVILCANTSLSSYLAVEFAATADGSGTHTDQIHLATSNGFDSTNGFNVAYRGSAITNVVANGDEYTVHYDDSAGALSVYKGTDTTPLGTWTDSTHLIPHGPGYRYVGLSFYYSTNTDGLQATSWQAIDDL